MGPKKNIVSRVATTTATATATATDANDTALFNVIEVTEREHILQEPDTWIGSAKLSPMENQWIYNLDTNTVTKTKVICMPALLKLFDEPIVNCNDHCIRMQDYIASNKQGFDPVTYIAVTVNKETGEFTFENDGTPIDVLQDPATGVWLPEKTFARLRTSTNYKSSAETQLTMVGGKNGFGMYLVFTWSIYAKIEIIDPLRRLIYSQEFRNNMLEIGVPSVVKMTAKTAKPMTRITIIPDYERLKLPRGDNGNILPDDVAGLLYRRVYDIAGISGKSVKVKLNGKIIDNVKTFEQYANLYFGTDKKIRPRIYEGGGIEVPIKVAKIKTTTALAKAGAGSTATDADEIIAPENTEENTDTVKLHWEYIVAISDTHEMQQMSFVNGIHTIDGGKHVDYIINQITKKLIEYIGSTQKGKSVVIKPASIKENIFLILRCNVVRPSFNSQSKTKLETPVSEFGTACSVSNKFIEGLAKKLGILDMACAISKARDDSLLSKMTTNKAGNTRSSKTPNIKKLQDAHWAGTDKSHMCYLCLTEGDSAAGVLVNSLTQDQKNYIGIFALRGKLLNVRKEKNPVKIAGNEELKAVMEIMNLNFKQEYATEEDIQKKLRYGHIVIVSDQDPDGSHIKGLGINFIEFFWPKLFAFPTFISYLNTPLLKAFKDKQIVSFYNNGEFENWKAKLDIAELKRWDLKYYKGLGSSTTIEFRQYINPMKLISFTQPDTDDIQLVQSCFNDDTDARKHMLMNLYDEHSFANTSQSNIPYKDFIVKELLHYFVYSCSRAMGSCIDGLKISQRKAIAAALFDKLNKPKTKATKVAELQGVMTGQVAYHHGDSSAMGTIISMAQDFVGSNNIALFMPIGQFGTRKQNGDDSGQPRYIYTRLHAVFNSIFQERDNPILEHLYDDGKRIEPKFYLPVIPFALVNGCSGMGTGFSTDVPTYSPLALCEYLENKLRGQSTGHQLMPYIEGFTGSIEQINNTQYLIRGKYEKLGTDCIRITEIPTNMSTEKFREHCLKLINGPTEEKAEKKSAATTAAIESISLKKGKKSARASASADDASVSSNTTATDITLIFPHSNDKLEDNSTEHTINIVLYFAPNKLAELENVTYANGVNGVEKLLKLTTTISLTNMHLFNSETKLVKFNSPEDVINEYYPHRYAGYVNRKKYELTQLERKLVELENKCRFITEIINNSLKINGLPKKKIIELLVEANYTSINDASDEDDDDDEDANANATANYNYLLNMKIHTLTKEKIHDLNKKKDDASLEYNTLLNTSIETMWLNDITEFKHAYREYVDWRTVQHAMADDLLPNENATATATAPATDKKPRRKLIVTKK